MRKYLFVYNADSGRLNALLDSIHKVVSPMTCDCQLCRLTYGVFKENPHWKSYRESLQPDEVVFLHRDEFEQEFQQKMQYPVLLKQKDDGFEKLLSPDDFNSVSDTRDLIALCRQVID